MIHFIITMREFKNILGQTSDDEKRQYKNDYKF